MKPGKIVIIYSFAVCLFLTVYGILSAKDATQLLNSFIFLPLIFYFGLKILHFPKKSVLKSVVSKKPSPEPQLEPVIVPGVSDNNKRLFLKLIGSTSISILLMALFTKKAQASFFGSVPGPGVVSLKDSAGNKIDPAEKKPTDGYEVSNIDDAGDPAYYGFVKKTGDWYILQNTSGTFIYAKGTDNYSTSWEIRNTLTYDYFNNVFG